MYRFFPKPNATEYPDYIMGICYNIRQEALIFGSNNNKDNPTRPVLSLKKRDSFLIVLPMTSKENKNFYHLSSDDCLLKSGDAKKIDSYVSYYDESLTVEAFKNAKQRGVLAHPQRIKIADWLKKRV